MAAAVIRMEMCFIIIGLVIPNIMIIFGKNEPHMRKVAIALALLLSLSLQARKLEPWQDPNVYEENRLPMRASFVADQDQTLSLNGIWRFHFSQSVASRLKGFEAPSYNDASWAEMPVPGLWELNGYGVPVYVNIGYAWKGLYESNPPFVPEDGNYVGQYRKVVEVPGVWKGKQVILVIGSATSNVRVWVNGKHVGYSQDSKLEARFDISKYVHPGSNVVALEIFRWCDGTYLEDQDFWRLSGLGRDVYLLARDKERLEDINVVADMSGNLSVKADVTSGISSVKFTLEDNGKALGSFEARPRKGRAEASAGFPGVKLWSAEQPNLYTLKVEAIAKGKVAASTSLQVGFRTVEISGAQLLVNGKPVLIKGVNRHELTPYKGYVITEEEMIRDIKVMKSLNVNAVRTCHYPDDPLWLSLCDKYGLYVVAEGNIESHGMGYGPETIARDPQYRAAHLIRDQRMVYRDRNHPAIIVWSMGNEAGFGPNFEACYKWIKAEDPTRPVQYERAIDNAHDRNFTDIMCPMYMSPENCFRYLENNPAKPLIQCEYAHTMGNSGGNFKDYWDLVRQYPSYQGGFIWDFQDQALWNGKYWAFGGDFNPGGPSDGSFNCNGVVASDRSLHPHAYEIRYQYQDIWTSGTPSALKIFNESFFRDLSDVMLLWDVEQDGVRILSGVVPSLEVGPQGTATVDLGLPELPVQGTLTLNIRYVLKKARPLVDAGSQVAYSQILLADRRPVLVENASGNIGIFQTGKSVILSGVVRGEGTVADRETVWTASFDKTSGALSSYTVSRKEMLSQPLVPCFNRAPIENDLGAALPYRWALWRNPSLEVSSFDISQVEGRYVIDVKYKPLGGIVPLSVFYEVRADGSVSVVEHMDAAPDAPDLFRFGMAFAMPGTYDQVDFFGLGPWENYIDRCSAAILGRFRQSVAEQYHMGYVRTQESGTHTGLRFFRVLDGVGNGLEVASVADFSASALPYSIADLDVSAPEGDAPGTNANGQRGIPRHSLELVPSGLTHVHVDAIQMGVGSVNSWGAEPLDKYHVHPIEREFRFVLSPVVSL